jgi:hypothetical protein
MSDNKDVVTAERVISVSSSPRLERIEQKVTESGGGVHPCDQLTIARVKPS